MSETLFLAILSLGELALIATGLAIFLFFRNRRIANNVSENPSPINETIDSEKSIPDLDFADFLQLKIEQSKQKLTGLGEDQTRLLEARLGFLQAEVNAQKEQDNSDAYWDHLFSDLEGLIPEPVIATTTDDNNDNNEDDTPILNELDDIDTQDDFDNIPTLENNVDQPTGVTKDPSITIENANEDLERLRKILSRQHDSMDELKQSLAAKDIDFENNGQLAKKLDEVETAQTQLNMCVETLEKENERLQSLIQEYENSPQAEELSQAKEDLEMANARIDNLEKENSVQAQHIAELESEIKALEKTLAERNEELQRLQSMEAGSSTEDNTTEHTPDSLMLEIENLTELITRKSEELSKLQSEQSDEFGFDSPISEADEEPIPDKAVGSE